MQKSSALSIYLSLNHSLKIFSEETALHLNAYNFLLTFYAILNVMEDAATSLKPVP